MLLQLADPLAHRKALRLAGSVAVEGHPDDRLAREAADQGAAAPLREHRARIEDQARGRNHRRPADLWRDEAVAGAVIGDVAAVIMAAVGDGDVTVIAAA